MDKNALHVRTRAAMKSRKDGLYDSEISRELELLNNIRKRRNALEKEIQSSERRDRVLHDSYNNKENTSANSPIDIGTVKAKLVNENRRIRKLLSESSRNLVSTPTVHRPREVPKEAVKVSQSNAIERRYTTPLGESVGIEEAEISCPNTFSDCESMGNGIADASSSSLYDDMDRSFDKYKRSMSIGPELKDATPSHEETRLAEENRHLREFVYLHKILHIVGTTISVFEFIFIVIILLRNA